jgi:hypothetical protein
MRTFGLGEILFLSSFALAPALFLAFLPWKTRWVIFLLGLAFPFASGWLIGPSGPDNPGLVIPLIGYGVAAGALLVEAIAFPIRLIRRARSATG